MESLILCPGQGAQAVGMGKAWCDAGPSARATFEEAVGIKIDEENNTNLTRANGDLNAEISLRLADTVERFIITIGKLGIFDQLG